MNEQKKRDIWSDHIGKIITFSNMIREGGWNLINLYDSGYPDEVIDAVINKLKVDLKALDDEHKNILAEVANDDAIHDRPESP